MKFSLGLLLEALFSVADTMLFSSGAGSASLALNGALSLDQVYEINVLHQRNTMFLNL